MTDLEQRRAIAIIDERAARVWLRDTFAAAALTGLLADTRREGTFEEFADSAYKFADAMLARKAETCWAYQGDAPAPAPLSSAPSKAAGGKPQTQPQPQ